MLSSSGLNDGFWGDAILDACYILNRVPNKRNKTTPYELWCNKKLNLNYLKVWGCRAIVILGIRIMRGKGSIFFIIISLHWESDQEV